MTPEKMISDAQIDRVHANARFGSMNKRDVVLEGCLSAAFGASMGGTQTQILYEHGLITGRSVSTSRPALSDRGEKYLRASISGKLGRIVDIVAKSEAFAEGVPEDRLLAIHGSANFGQESPRRVLADSLVKASVGFSSGSTARGILHAHGFSRLRRGRGERSILTVKGKALMTDIFIETVGSLLKAVKTPHRVMQAVTTPEPERNEDEDLEDHSSPMP